jgi:hypothetical protein
MSQVNSRYNGCAVVGTRGTNALVLLRATERQEGADPVRISPPFSVCLHSRYRVFGGRDGRMLAARVEPKNGTWKRMKKPAGSDLQGVALASVLPHVTTDHRAHSVGSLD